MSVRLMLAEHMAGIKLKVSDLPEAIAKHALPEDMDQFEPLRHASTAPAFGAHVVAADDAPPMHPLQPTKTRKENLVRQGVALFRRLLSPCMQRFI